MGRLAARSRRAPQAQPQVPASVQFRDRYFFEMGRGGVDFPAVIAVLRERNYDGWISLDFNAADMAPGVTIEQDMAAHRKYLVETLHASMSR